MTRIAVSPSDPDDAYVTLSGYREGEDLPHVLVTDDGGESWDDISGNLPEAPDNDIEYDSSHRRLVAAIFGRSMYELGV